MLIDFHTHCFPDKLCKRAIASLREESGNIEAYTDGSLEGLKKLMKETGVDISVVQNIATNAHQMKSVNDFAASINNEEDIFAFGSVFPFAPDAMEELERIKALGLKGVKFHPEYQGFEADDPKLFPIYKKVSSLGLISLFHAGVDFGFSPPYRAMPKAMAKAASVFDSPVIAAHWGGVQAGDGVLEYLCGENVWFDLSFGYSMMPKYYAEKIVEKHGVDKLLFGTDAPWHRADMEMRLINALGFSDDEMDSVTWKNASELLGIKAQCIIH